MLKILLSGSKFTIGCDYSLPFFLISFLISVALIEEIFSGKKEIARGGRYDDLLKSLGAKKNIPAVGAAINLNNI